MKTIALVSIVLALVGAAVGVPYAAPAAAQAIDWPQIALTGGISGFSYPVYLTHAGDGSGRMFVVEQRGRVRIVRDSVVQSGAFLDISNRVSCCGERGLLSVAFPPNFGQTGLFYAYYTDLNGDITVSRFQAVGDAANPASEQLVIRIAHRLAGNHNGGQLQFGPDGFLYLGTGDGGGAGDTSNNAQNLNILLGKLIRIDVEGQATYRVPDTNPFVLGGGLPEIWAFGLRNPWRFSFDRANGDLYLGDVGQGAREEIDVQRAGDSGGRNYGWRCREGAIAFNPTGCEGKTFVSPVVDYDHNFGCSVTGGYVYRGPTSARMQGTYFYGDYCSGRIWALKQVNCQWISQPVADTPYNLSSFGEDEAGRLYAVHHADGGGGAIYQVVDNGALPAFVGRRVSPVAADSNAVFVPGAFVPPLPPVCAAGAP